MKMAKDQQMQQMIRIASLQPTALSRIREIELIPTPRYTPAAKIACATPRSFGRVKSDKRLTLTGTQEPMNIAKPILAGRIPPKLCVYVSKKVHTVQNMQAITQIHFLLYMSARCPKATPKAPFVKVNAVPVTIPN